MAGRWMYKTRMNGEARENAKFHKAFPLSTSGTFVSYCGLGGAFWKYMRYKISYYSPATFCEKCKRKRR